MLKKTKECIFEVNFNQLGMIIISCKTHGDSDITYDRAKSSCYFKFVKLFESIIKRELKTSGQKNNNSKLELEEIEK